MVKATDEIGALLGRGSSLAVYTAWGWNLQRCSFIPLATKKVTRKNDSSFRKRLDTNMTSTFCFRELCSRFLVNAFHRTISLERGGR
ncbi:hypothetical protein M378DRAFT_164790 [Amanita muscaria Koide BX008]|uniref:Uncharacterized protein n=1 Tax=Amanita muscaria (strain Koide BX008) TaxID=946122 RepID=A0A0C2T9C2_AMAMK|nr:hypothetical protein M378DRAFT_164790 [Amanita muscaria Koide BX008]